MEHLQLSKKTKTKTKTKTKKCKNKNKNIDSSQKYFWSPVLSFELSSQLLEILVSQESSYFSYNICKILHLKVIRLEDINEKCLVMVTIMKFTL